MTTTDTTAGAAPRSRPRVSGDRAQEILDAALDVLREVGYDKLTLDTVAARARASKATLYRRWATKPALVADALCHLDGDPHVPDTGSLREDLLAMAREKQGSILDPAQMDLACGLSTAMYRDAELGAALKERYLDPRKACLRDVLERARARGEVADGVDVDLVGQVLPAVILFRLSFGPLDEPFDELVHRIVDQIVLPALRAGAPGPTSSPATG